MLSVDQCQSAIETIVLANTLVSGSIGLLIGMFFVPLLNKAYFSFRSRKEVTE